MGKPSTRNIISITNNDDAKSTTTTKQQRNKPYLQPRKEKTKLKTEKEEPATPAGKTYD